MRAWNDSLCIGINEIDTQHKYLCDAIDSLLDACKVGKGRTEILKTVDFLERYTMRHFKDEEELQKKCGYPKYDEHKAMHEIYVNRIKEIKSDIEKNGANIGSVALLNVLLLEWLVKHITVVDKEISNYIR